MTNRVTREPFGEIDDHPVEKITLTNDLGMSLATQAAVVLANSQAYWEAYQLTQTLQEAMRSRPTARRSSWVPNDAPPTRPSIG